MSPEIKIILFALSLDSLLSLTWNNLVEQLTARVLRHLLGFLGAAGDQSGPVVGVAGTQRLAQKPRDQDCPEHRVTVGVGLPLVKCELSSSLLDGASL